MYLRRKIDSWLTEWKNSIDKSPALVVGIRQCGKTKSIESFAENNYKKVIKLNFWDSPEYQDVFEVNLDVDNNY